MGKVGRKLFKNWRFKKATAYNFRRALGTPVLNCIKRGAYGGWKTAGLLEVCQPAKEGMTRAARQDIMMGVASQVKCALTPWIV